MTETKPNASSAEFEKKAEQWYNSNKDEQGVVRINTKNLAPLNDPRCQHDWYHDVDDADNEWAVVVKCRKCPIGRLLAKS